MQSFEWAIEDIISAYPALVLDYYAVKAVVMMKHAGSPCEFLVETEGFDLEPLGPETPFILRITWGEEIDRAADRMERTEQRTPIVEGAAIALAALWIAHFLRDSEMHVMVRGNRTDYWLPNHSHVVEISGTEQPNELARRHRQKRGQLLENLPGMDGYVIVCCFAPAHRLIRWSYHTQQE